MTVQTIFDEEQSKLLSSPIHPDRVSERKQGNQTLSYVEAVEVIRAANGIFGFGNWGYSVKDGPKVVAQGVRQYTGKDPVPWYLWQETVTLTIRAPSGAAISMDGVGASIQSGDGPEGAEMAVKAADTDALKRALKNYGNQFGLSLYDKEDVQNIEENYKEWRARERAARQAKGDEPTPAPSEPPAPSGEPTEAVPAVSLREQARAMAAREVPKEPEPEAAEDDWAAADEVATQAGESNKGSASSPEAIAAWKSTLLFGSLGKDDIKAICNVNAKGDPTTLRKELVPYFEMSVDECKSYFKEHGLTGSLAGAMLETMMNIEEDTPNKRYPLVALTDNHLAFYQKEMPGRTYIDLMYEAVEWGADKLREKSHFDRARKWLEDNPRSQYEQFA